MHLLLLVNFVNFYNHRISLNFLRMGRTCLQCSQASPDLVGRQTLSLVGGHTLEFELCPLEGGGVLISSQH